MEERERPELTNPELDALLQEWRTPVAPPRLRSAVFPRRSVPWYGRWLTSISIPVPVVAILCVLLVLLGWQWGARRERARAETAHGGVATAPAVTFQGFSPVAELRPRIIRSHHAPN
jgi:hypothetical protein